MWAAVHGSGFQVPSAVVKTEAYMSQYHIAHRLFAGYVSDLVNRISS